MRERSETIFAENELEYKKVFNIFIKILNLLDVRNEKKIKSKSHFRNKISEEKYNLEDDDNFKNYKVIKILIYIICILDAYSILPVLVIFKSTLFNALFINYDSLLFFI